MAKFNKKNLPSRHTSLGADRAPHRSFYYAMGETEKDVAKPFPVPDHATSLRNLKTGFDQVYV